MKRQLIILTILILLTSCSANYFITVKHDGTATVNIDRDSDSKDINRYYQSGVISNIDTTFDNHARVTFEITDIDSLGTYLPFHPSGFFKFDMQGDTLTITDGHTQAFKQNDLFCCGVFMFIKFDNEIQQVETANRLAMKKEKKTVLIKKSRRQLIKNKRQINVKIRTTGGNRVGGPAAN
jgi:hypothetical protein